MNQINRIVANQRDLQHLVKFPIDTIVESERNELGELYLFKAIEEIVELRKEFPSAMNKWSKSQKPADMGRIKEEFSDVLLFLINFAIVFKIDLESIGNVIEQVQEMNLRSIKQKMLNQLNEDILKVPNCIAGTGGGNISPQYIFIGQNPGKDIPKGYRFWSKPEDGSSRVLLPILERMGILEDCYFTNIGKSTTVDNSFPTKEMTDFWKEFLKKEIDILSSGIRQPVIIAMGKWVDENLGEYQHISIPHPASTLYGNQTTEEYEQIIRKAITLDN